MMDEEIKTDCGKFIDYLQANGAQVLAFAILTDTTRVRWGNAEMLNEMAASLLADQLGYRLVAK